MNMKYLPRFLLLFSVAILLGIGIFNAQGVKKLLKNSETKTKEINKDEVAVDFEGDEKIIPDKIYTINQGECWYPSIKTYNVKYVVECNDSLDGYFIYSYQKIYHNIKEYELYEETRLFSKKTYPVKNKKLFIVEMEVYSPFDINLNYINNSEFKTTVSIYIDGNLMEVMSINPRNKNKVFWQITE